MTKIRLNADQIGTLINSLHIARSWWDTARQEAQRVGVPALAEYAMEQMDDIDTMLPAASSGVERITVRLRDDIPVFASEDDGEWL